MKKSDIIAVLVLGEIIALVLNFIANLVFNKSSIFLYSFNLPFWVLLIVLPPLALFALFITYLIGKKISVAFQFGKYAAVGFANTVIDFGILNFLMWTTGVYRGGWIYLLNSASFIIAITHSYLWNRYWSFDSHQKDITKQFLTFLIVTVIGAVINGGIVYGITTFMSPLADLSSASWANAAKVLATAVAFMWNFLGYKFVVFKKKNVTSDL